MKPAARHWKIQTATALAGFHPVLGRILAARGLDQTAATAFLQDGQIHDPFLLKGMTEAVDVIAAAISNKEKIAVYGDYDADGVCACTLLTLGLRAAGVEVVPYIPNRMSEGYGLHAAALQELYEQDVTCVVTVDCGTSSTEVAAGRPQSMRLVITDHHLPHEPDGSAPQLANADALINPKQPGDTYPFDGLAGAGVALKLVQALIKQEVIPADYLPTALAFAAIGTVSDMMKLQDENRAIVLGGLESLVQNPPVGIAALAELAGIRGQITSSDLGFAIGPRINAAGRMEDALLALQLCLAKTKEEALPLAQQLNAQNSQRQQAVKDALAQAEEQVALLADDLPAIVLGEPHWPMGIVGLVAGRLAEKYARPTFIVSLDPDEAKGSARTPDGFHIVKALDKATKVLNRYGGHALAAGFSLDARNFDEFAELIIQAVAEQAGDQTPERIFHIDTELTIDEINPELCQALDDLEPCGQGNYRPQFCLCNAEVLNTKTFGSDKNHVGIIIKTPQGMTEAVAFNKPGLAEHLPKGRKIDLCFSLELDTWNGQERVRLRLRDLRPAKVSSKQLAKSSL